MKKTIKTIFLIIFMWIALALISKVNAATATISYKPTNPTVGDKVTVTVSINAAAWNLKVSGNAADSIIDYNSEGENKVTTKTYTVTRNTAGTATVKLTGDVTDGTTDENTQINTSATINFKAKTTSSGSTGTSGGNNSGSSGSSGSSNGSTTTTKPTTPIFTNANKTVYTTGDVNLRSSWSTKSAATLVEKGTELKLTGTSKEVIDGYTWYKVTYKGQTKYIASSLITETKPKEEEPNKSSNKNLSTLKIKDVELSPKFSKEVTQYTAKVDGDVTKLDITSKAEDSKAKVTVEGNKDLKEGDNIIKIKVTAEDETTRTYFVTVTKGEETADNKELKLASLDIARVDFGESFKPDTFTYELSLNEYVKNLEITATPNQEDAKVEITGNDEFKAGKNMVVILLTSADGEQTATYQIEVNLPEEAIAKAEETSNSSTLYYIIAGVAIALALIIIVVVIIRSRSNRYDDEYEDEEEFEEEPEYIDNKLKIEEDEEEVKPTRKREPKVTVDDFLNIPDDDDDNKPPRRPRGRHSV